MTPRQLLVLEAIEDYWTQNHCGPSLEAIAKQVGVSSRSTIHAIVKRLHEDGWITMQPKRWRTMMSTRNSPLEKKEAVVEEKLEPAKPKVIHKTAPPEQKTDIVVEKKISSENMTTEEKKKEWLRDMDAFRDRINKLQENT
jgi:SOS-response transcriptional repressor LexA|tara:strand:+ start:110 stop:532 length:423 start_codon:yes stop_codon:yes gene_type:complete